MTGLYTDSDLALINLETESRDDVIERLGRLALAKGLVSEEFVSNVLRREQEFPTGLDTVVPVAIPHIGEGCHRSFLAVATLKSPVLFGAMDGSEREIGVRIVFLFGITNPQEQVEVLKRFVAVFQERGSLERMIRFNDPEEAICVLKALMGECLITGQEVQGK